MRRPGARSGRARVGGLPDQPQPEVVAGLQPMLMEEEKSGASSEGDREVELLSSAVTYSKGATIDRL